MVYVVATPESHELPHQIGDFRAYLSRTGEEDRIRPILLSDLPHLLGYDLQSFIPAYPLPLTVSLDHRIPQPLRGVYDVVCRSPLTAKLAPVYRVVNPWFNPQPFIVLYNSQQTATNCTTGADRFYEFVSFFFCLFLNFFSFGFFYDTTLGVFNQSRRQC